MTKNISRTIRVTIATVMVADARNGGTQNFTYELPFECPNTAKILKTVQQNNLTLDQVAVSVVSITYVDRFYTMPVELFMELATVDPDRTREVNAL